MSDVTIFPARAVHTFDGGRQAPAVAVRDGRVLAVGDVDTLHTYGDAAVDDRLADKVILPGFVEAHCHSMAGGFWQFGYVGYFDRVDPSGTHWPGCTSIDEVLDRLRELSAAIEDPAEPLIAWGLDPIYFPGVDLFAADLDRVSEQRPIFVLHASIHLATVNSALMAREGIDRTSQAEGVARDGDGEPNGELREFAAMALATETFRRVWAGMGNEAARFDFGRVARNAGVTTLTELGSAGLGNPGAAEKWLSVIEDPEFPARVSLFHNPGMGGPAGADEAAEFANDLRGHSTAKARFGNVKLVLDGSIQGFTARLNWPGYYDGSPNGQWVMAPPSVEAYVPALLREGVLLHAHCNGDQAVDVFLDAVEAGLTAHPRRDHRTTVQHSQLTTPAQYRRIAAMGLSANIFANHTFFWGDQHVAYTVGPDRAARMNAARTALDLGVQLSMHSDAAVTPLSSLHVAWCAVNRLTASGAVLGPEERITVAEALHAVTIGAAYQLRMDDEVGTLAPGKYADFAILDADPFEVDPVELRDIPVWGSALAGDVFGPDRLQ